ncbi:MAG TPA: sodium/proline symporter [candidate division Zixibacteria bacterium]|nr:sodium/proline symporter [candidate division Zixibacteria bacterium]
MESNLLLTLSFACYSLLIVAVGLYSTRRQKETADDYVLANRELGPIASSLSASASAESGWVMLGLVGEAYRYGSAAFWIVPGIAAGYVFNWFFIGERLRKSTLDTGAVTVPQYIMHRYGRNSSALRYISVTIITLAMLGYVAAQMNAAGKAFEAVFELKYWVGVLAGAVIVLAYTISGGFRAIAWTDVMQASFMFVALIIMPFIILYHIGGYGQFIAQVHMKDPSLLSFGYGQTAFAAIGFIVGLLGIGLGYPGQPHVIVRFMATKDKKSIGRGGAIALTWMILVYFGAIFFGLFSRIYFGHLADPEQALPIGVREFLNPVVGGLIIAAIVAAICSTADSQLMVMASTVSRDVVPIFRRKKQQSEHADLSYREIRSLDQKVLIIFGLLSVFFALTKNRVIFDFVLYAWSVLGASFGPLIILGLFWKKTNRQGAIAGMITGLVVTVVWRNIPALKSALYELVPAFILAFIAVVIVSLATGNESRTEPTSQIGSEN